MTEHRKLRVFLCHSSQDKAIVRELYKRLDTEGWIEPWLDEEKLLPGQDWDMEIEKAVEAADAVIVCLSNNSTTKEGYIQKEIKKVLDVSDEKPDETIFIIPLRLDECELPRRLAKWQYLDYFPEDKREKSYQKLLRSLNLCYEKFSSHQTKTFESPIKENKKIITSISRPNHHTALKVEVIGRNNANGVNFIVAKLQWGKDDIGFSLHAEPTSYTSYGMQTTDFLAYLGFARESCSFVTRKVCYANWIDNEFDIPVFVQKFGEAFRLFEKSTRLFEECGHFLNQPEGWEYFYPNSKRRIPRMKSGNGGDGHNANHVEDMKRSEDDNFLYQFSWIERTNSKGWVIHYRPKDLSTRDIFTVLQFLDLNSFKECPQFDFEQCYWMFIEYQNKGDSFFEGNAEFAHRCFDFHEKNFSSAVQMLITANDLISPFGFQFLNPK